MKEEKGIGLLVPIGSKKSEGEDGDTSDSKKLAAKAMFKAIKRDDFEDYYEALCEFQAEYAAGSEED